MRVSPWKVCYKNDACCSFFSLPPPIPPCSGIVEVFGSWGKVAPRLDVTNFEVEKQLEEAMKEHESMTSTVVSTGNTAKTGFHPLDGSQ